MRVVSISSEVETDHWAVDITWQRILAGGEGGASPAEGEASAGGAGGRRRKKLGRIEFESAASLVEDLLPDQMTSGNRTRGRPVERAGVPPDSGLPNGGVGCPG